MNVDRRQGWLLALAVLVGLAAAVDQIWLPLQARHAALQAEVARARALHDWVADNLPRVRAAATAADVTDLPAAAEALQGSLRRFALDSVVTRIEPREDRVLVSVQGAPFDAMVSWLAVLEGELGLRVLDFSLVRSEAAGRVDGALSFATGATPGRPRS